MNTKYYVSRKRAWTKYNRSEKKKVCNQKYREAHKEQCSRWATEWQRKNSKRVRELAKLRYATPEGKAIRREIEKRYCEKNRIKRLAKDAIHNALKAKKIMKQGFCSRCGSEVKIEGHHPNYNKPLEIVWVCKSCHTAIHVERKTGV